MEHGGDIYGNQNIELDFSVNLSPIGPPEAVRGALQDDDLLKVVTSYPDPQCRELTASLAQKLQIPQEWILCGNGASELIMAAVQAIRPALAMIPAPTYQGYERALSAGGAEVLYYELDREKGFALTEEILESPVGLKSLADMKKSNGTKAILFLCNPNNPVGNCIEPVLLNKISEYCRRNHIYLVLDECYLDLLSDAALRTMRHKLSENPYLIIVNAFTKTYAMPGIRLGYLMADNEELLSRIAQQKPEWSVSMLAQRAGALAITDTEYLHRARKTVREEREYVCGMLRGFGAEVFEGEGPFVLFISGKELYEPLRERGILIRRFDRIQGIGNRTSSEGYYYRVGLRSHEENERLMKLIGELMEESR